MHANSEAAPTGRRAGRSWLSLVLAIEFLTAMAAVSAASAAGDAIRGEQIYQRCGACHSLDRNRTGPRHCGVVGRPAGSVPGYAYSRAMKNSKLTWDERTLDRFIADPLHFLPGTKMGYAGVKDAAERADLIEYLKQVSADPQICN